MTFDEMIQPSATFGGYEIGNGTYGGMEDVLVEMSALSDAELGRMFRQKMLQTVELDGDSTYSFRDYLEGSDHPQLIDEITAAQQAHGTVQRPVIFQPEKGNVYRLRDGGSYECISSKNEAVLRHTATGWTFTAHGCQMNPDGTIEWTHSTDGRFTQPQAQEVTEQSMDSRLSDAAKKAAEINAGRTGMTAPSRQTGLEK